MMASCSKPAKVAEEEANTTGPNWLDLPKEVTKIILQKLSVEDNVIGASKVCSLWWKISKNPLMWRTINMTKLPDYTNPRLLRICSCAVKRSCGQLEEISIEIFATDELLYHIAKRASQLRRVRLPKCYALSDEGMTEIVKKLPLLEELDISFTNLSEDALEAIGRCCPLLKTLKYNTPVDTYVYDQEAFAIAKTMPELRYLEIGGNKLSNHGLRAILYGCPLLEYIDLRHCYKLDLSGSLGKMLCEKIKEIRLPLNLGSNGPLFDLKAYMESELEHACQSYEFLEVAEMIGWEIFRSCVIFGNFNHCLQQAWFC